MNVGVEMSEIVRAEAKKVSEKAVNRAIQLIQRMSDMALFQTQIKTRNGMVKESTKYDGWDFYGDDMILNVRGELDCNAENIKDNDKPGDIKYRSKEITILVRLASNWDSELSLKAIRLMYGFNVEMRFKVDQTNQNPIQNVHNHVWVIALMETIQKKIMPDIKIYDNVIYHKAKANRDTFHLVEDCIDSPDADEWAKYRNVKPHDASRLFAYYNTTEQMMNRYYMPDKTKDNSARLRILMVRQNNDSVMTFDTHVEQLLQECSEVCKRLMD